MKWLWISLFCVTGCAALSTSETSDPSAKKPNIVFVLADDLGYGDAVCYNPQSKCLTPNIDALAASGMRFTDAHAPASVCVPSRYGLMTGRFPFRGDLDWRRKPCIAPNRTTIASLLKRSGYDTAMVGKWHLGFEGGPDYDYGKPLKGGPVDRGFDTFFGMHASLDIPPYFYMRGDRAVKAPTETIGDSHTEGWSRIQGAFWRGGPIAPDFKHEQVLPTFAREAVAYLDGRGKSNPKPFFLYVAFTGPHTPWLPLEKYRGIGGAEMYSAFVAQVDDTLGQILAALKRNGLDDDTLVIFSSDNGPVWYPDDVARFDHASSGPLRGVKSDAWEGGHRVPLTARWPGRIAAGSTSDVTISFTDMMATFAAITDQELGEGEGEDSVDILPIFLGQQSTLDRAPLVLKENASVIRSGRYKLIDHLGSGGFISQPKKEKSAPGGPEGQLYDLSADLGEQHNLWQEQPEIAKDLSAKLKTIRGR